MTMRVDKTCAKLNELHEKTLLNDDESSEKRDNENKKDFLDFLPLNIRIEIFLNLNFTDLFAFGLTSRNNNRIIKGDSFWEQLLKIKNFERIVKSNANWNENLKTIDHYKDQPSIYLNFRNYMVDLLRIIKSEKWESNLFPIDSFEKLNKISEQIIKMGKNSAKREANIMYLVEKDGMTRKDAEDLYDSFN